MKRSLILSFVTVSTARAASILSNAFSGHVSRWQALPFPREQAAPLSASSNQASHPVRRRKKNVEVRRPEGWLSGSLDQPALVAGCNLLGDWRKGDGPSCSLADSAFSTDLGERGCVSNKGLLLTERQCLPFWLFGFPVEPRYKGYLQKQTHPCKGTFVPTSEVS